MRGDKAHQQNVPGRTRASEKVLDSQSAESFLISLVCVPSAGLHCQVGPENIDSLSVKLASESFITTAMIR